MTQTIDHLVWHSTCMILWWLQCDQVMLSTLYHRIWSEHSFPGLPCPCFYSMQKLSPNWKDQMGLLILGVRLRPGKLFHISTHFLWDLPPQLSLHVLPFKLWHTHFDGCSDCLPPRKSSKWLIWNKFAWPTKSFSSDISVFSFPRPVAVEKATNYSYKCLQPKFCLFTICTACSCPYLVIYELANRRRTRHLHCGRHGAKFWVRTCACWNLQ